MMPTENPFSEYVWNIEDGKQSTGIEGNLT